VSPEDADKLWWDEMTKLDWHESSGDQETQHQMRMRCWMTMIGHIRKPYQDENERLRQENRDLKYVITESMRLQAA
jgi:hypothetical protein